MKTIQYHDIRDRNQWQQPEIIPENERTLDKQQWLDEETGMPCLMVRNFSGVWCGYVGVNNNHPLYGIGYGAGYASDVDLDKDQSDMLNAAHNAAHAELTFSSKCSPDDKEHGICHIVEDGEDDNVWWFGFDCGHSYDKSPSYDMHISDGATYCTKAYVEDVCHNLAKALIPS